MEKKGLQFYHGILAFALAMLILLFGGYLLIPLFGKVGAMLAGVFIALIGVAFTVMTKTKMSEVLPHEAPPIRSFVGGLLMYIAIVMLNGIYGVAMSPFVDITARQSTINSIVLDLNPAAAILLVAVLPAVCEEFFCRGFLAHCFRALKREWLIVLITGAAFGVMHLDLYSFFPSAMMGILFGYLAIKTHSLIVPMLLHFINNAFSVVITFFTASESAGEEVAVTEALNLGQTLGMLAFYLGIGALCLYGGYCVFHRRRFMARCGVLVLVLSLVLSVGGCGVMTLSSLEMVCTKTDTVTYHEAFEITIPLSLEEGEYQFILDASADDPIEIALLRVTDEKEMVVRTTAFQTEPSFSELLSLKEGEYRIVIRTKPNAETGIGSVSYQVIVCRLAM